MAKTFRKQCNERAFLPPPFLDRSQPTWFFFEYRFRWDDIIRHGLRRRAGAFQGNIFLSINGRNRLRLLLLVFFILSFADWLRYCFIAMFI